MAAHMGNSVETTLFISQVHPHSIDNNIKPIPKATLELPDTITNNLIDELSRNQTNESGLDLSYYFEDAYPKSRTNNLPEEQPSIVKRERSLSAGSALSVIINQYQEAQQTHRKENSKKLQQNEVDSASQYQSTEQYQCKVDKSNKKAFQFFGEPIKLNIPIKEIKREGLRALVYSSVPLGYFLYHLLTEYCSENLFFYLAVEYYKQNGLLSYAEKKRVAIYIMKTYLTRNSELEINLEDKVSRQIQQTWRQQNEFEFVTGKEFDIAKKHIFSLLNVSYHRFRTSSLWEVMESKYNAYSEHNMERLQTLTVNLLTSFVTKHKDENPTISRLVLTFCKMYLPLGYQVYMSNKETNAKQSSSKINTRRSRSKSIGNESRRFITSTFDIFKLNKKT